MKGAQSSLESVLERGTEFRASPHLHLPSTRTHKPQFSNNLSSFSHPKNPYIFMGMIHWRQSSWAPFIGTTLLILKQSYTISWYLPCSGQRTDPLNTSALQTSRFQPDQTWPVPNQLPFPQMIPYRSCSAIKEVISSLTLLKALK